MRPYALLSRSLRLHAQLGTHYRPLHHRYGLGNEKRLPLGLMTVSRAIGKRNLHYQSLLDASLQTTHEAIASLHAVTHTPWFLTIPLVALGVNVLFRLPFVIHAQKIAQHRMKLAPLFQAWAQKHFRDVAKDGTPPGRQKAEATLRHVRTSKKLYREWGLQQWKMHGSILSFPLWLLVIETVRRMCGGPSGLLGQLFGTKQVDAAEPDAVPAAESPVAALPPTDVSALSTAGDGSALETVTSAVVLYEPSLTTGGCLWFQDLTIADPYHVLPFALSAVLVANLIPKSDVARRALFGLGPPKTNGAAAAGPVVAQSRMMRGLHRGLLLVSASVGVITLHFPSAIHLYWLASSCVSYLLVKGVNHLMPIPKMGTRPSRSNDLPVLKGPPP